MLAAVEAKAPQAPKGAQLVLDVTEALRNLESLCPGRAYFGNGSTPDKRQ